MEQVNSPFSKEQVDNLNDFQKAGMFHPFTCCGQGIPECKRDNSYKRRREGEEIPYTDENEGVLIATTEGWVCPCGKYTQNWAHDFMSQPQQKFNNEDKRTKI